MKKYDLAAIMRKAWEIYRSHKAIRVEISFGECLRRAWASAKSASEQPAKKTFTGSANIDGFRFIAWEKYGKRRIYISNYSGHNASNKGGYIDLDNGNRIVASGCVKSAAHDFLSTYAI